MRKDTRQTRRYAKHLFATCVVEGKLEVDRVRQVAQALAERKPRGVLAIMAHFQRLVKLELHRRSVRIESAVPLSGPAQGALQAQLAQRYGTGLAILYADNPALLGGVRLRVGDDIFDGSIQARLRQLQENF